jgi:hypothetical protein
MKIRLAQHTVDCSGDHAAAASAWKARGAAWLALPGVAWQAAPEPPQAVVEAPEAGAEGPGGAWTCVSARLGATLSLLHLVEPGPHGTRFHARAEVEGPLAWLHRLALQAPLRARLPEALRAVARSVAATPPA